MGSGSHCSGTVGNKRTVMIKQSQPHVLVSSVFMASRLCLSHVSRTARVPGSSLSQGRGQIHRAKIPCPGSHSW